MRGEAEQRIVLERRPVAVEHHRHAAAARRLADRLHEIRIAIVGQHRVGRGDDGLRDRPASSSAIRSSR